MEGGKGSGGGVGGCGVDGGAGTGTHVQPVPGIVNPSFLTLDHRHRFLYSAHGDGGEATAFQIDPQSGHLRLLNRQSTGGKNGVRLIVDPTDRFLVVANYSSGTVAVLPLSPDGSLGPLSDLVSLPGQPGPHRSRQDASHPHDTVFDRGGRFIAVPDLGLDKVFVYKLDVARGKLVANDPPFVTARPGAGPPHVDFHPRNPSAYAITHPDSSTPPYPFHAVPAPPPPP